MVRMLRIEESLAAAAERVAMVRGTSLEALAAEALKRVVQEQTELPLEVPVFVDGKPMAHQTPGWVENIRDAAYEPDER